MSSSRIKPSRIKQHQHCVVCFTQGNSCGLQELTAEDLICIEKISTTDINLRSEKFEEKLVICSVCKLTLQFVRKFIKMCQKTNDLRNNLKRSSAGSVSQLEPEFLDIKIIQSINDLIDWVDLSMSQFDLGTADTSLERDGADPSLNNTIDILLKDEVVDQVYVELIKSPSPQPEMSVNPPNNELPCDICGQVVDNLKKLRKHLKSVHKVEQKDKFICDKCGGEFPSKIRLSYHLNGHYGIKPFVCKFEDCGKTFTNPSRLRNHKNEFHLKLITSYCDQCGRGFRTKAARDIHLKGHAEPTIPCEVCGKLLTNKKTLTQHLKIHKNERKHQCQYCDKAFIKSCALTIHLRSHTKDTPYTCPECGMGFAYNVGLRKHRAKVHQVDIKFYKKGSINRKENLLQSKKEEIKSS